MSREALGNFEFMILLAILRLGDEAYGVPIADEIESVTGREVMQGSVYAALERLEAKELVASSLGEPTSERGGRAKRYFVLTTRGLREARAAQRAFIKLWSGLPALRGGSA